MDQIDLNKALPESWKRPTREFFSDLVKLRDLERELSLLFAKEFIELNAEESSCLDGGGWWDVTPEHMPAPDRDMIACCVLLLELRGLLERHPSDPNIIRIKEAQ